MASGRWTWRLSIVIPRASRIASAVSWLGAEPAWRRAARGCARVARHPAALADRVGDVLVGDRAEEAAVVAGLLGEGQHGPVQQLGVLGGPRDGLLGGALLGLGLAPG